MPPGSRFAAVPADARLAPWFAGVSGCSESKPWEYRVTACIPHLETVEPLAVCIDVLRCQTERPYIVIIDTGSSTATRRELEKFRAADLEIHYIAAHGYRHPSEPVAVALDLAHAVCRTDYLFHSHSDCFLTRDDFLAELVARCDRENPVIGYRMSPRDWATDEWQWMVGHTATLLHMPTMHSIGATWSMQRARSQFGYSIDEGRAGGWPDTETAFNRVLRDSSIAPEFIGADVNGERQTDGNIDHVRSYAGSKLYSKVYHEKATPWMVAALTEARVRVVESKRKAALCLPSIP